MDHQQVSSRVEQRVAKVSNEINHAISAKRGDFESRLEMLKKDGGSVKHRMFKLHAILSDIRQLAAPHVACKKGCSNCCHQHIVISQTEANAIGYAIGRSPKMLPILGHEQKSGSAFGQHTPCVFLAKGECSIYDHRPMMCRNNVNLDETPELCSFENWDKARAGEPHQSIPMLAIPPKIDQAYRVLSGNGRDVFADIRDFFPAT